MSSSMSSSAEELSESSDAELEIETDSDVDGDLEDLYTSFDFEDDVGSQPGSSQTQPETVENPTAHAFPALGVSNSPLYPSAQLMTFQSHLLVFQYALCHSLTKRAFTELLQLLSVHLPPGARVPKSVHYLKQVLVEAFPEARAEQHAYCSCCQRLIPSGAHSCEGGVCSGGRLAVFITLPIGPQLKRMMEGIYIICCCSY